MKIYLCSQWQEAVNEKAQVFVCWFVLSNELKSEVARVLAKVLLTLVRPIPMLS